MGPHWGLPNPGWDELIYPIIIKHFVTLAFYTTLFSFVLCLPCAHFQAV